MQMQMSEHGYVPIKICLQKEDLGDPGWFSH